MDYQRLGAADKREIVEQSLYQLETEHYTLALRLAAYDGARDVSDENKREMVQQTQDRIASIEAAIAVYREELAGLS